MTKQDAKSLFYIRFAGDGVNKYSLPTRALAEALDAVQKILANVYVEGSPVTLHLTSVRSGSAVFTLESGIEIEQKVTLKLRQFGEALDPDSWSGDGPELTDEELLKPIETLSLIARRHGVTVELRGRGGARNVLATIGPASFEEIESRTTVSGQTSLFGQLERLGGVDDQHCVIRVPQQSKQLWCRLTSRQIVSDLGNYMYRSMLFRGLGVWYRRSGVFKSFQIESFDPPPRGTIRDSLRAASEAGLNGWDEVEDVRATVSEMRGE